MLCDRHCDATDIHFLERIQTQKISGNIACYRHHRHRIHIRGGYTCNKVGGTGTRSRKNDTRPARCTRIAVSRMAGSLFMRGDNVSDPVGILIECIIDIQHCTARIAENGVNALFYETFNNNFRTVKLHNKSLLVYDRKLTVTNYSLYNICPRLSRGDKKRTLPRKSSVICIYQP